MRRLLFVLALVAATTAGQVGCRSTVAPTPGTSPPWDVERAEVVVWSADDPAFEQGFALEASGLAASRETLVVPSEKYGRLLLIDVSHGAQVRVVQIAVPAHAELEGVALFAGGVLLCDEAHATVYEVPLDDRRFASKGSFSESLPVMQLRLEGVDVSGGKIGFEGIEIDPDDGTVHLLLERTGNEVTGCVSRIWALRREDGILHSDRSPIEVQLEDCAWRLTGLAWWEGRMIALKTQYPGERYEVVVVDASSGETEVLLDLTELLRSLAGQGWSNNVEGIAVADDGSLWLVADNAVTGVIDDPLPTPGDSRTLLLHLPPSE